MSNGLGMYANTPPLSASAAARVSALAVIMMTGMFVHAQTAHLLEELEAPHARHVHVQQDQIELALQQDDQRLRTVFRRLGLVRVRVAELAEEVFQDLDHRGLVVDDQDSLGHSGSI